MHGRLIPFWSSGLVILAVAGLTVRANAQDFFTLHNFSPMSDYINGDGATPLSGVILSGNFLYGTAVYGGMQGEGVAYKVRLNGTGFQDLNDFGSAGALPGGALVISQGALFGTTMGDGNNDLYGSIFEQDTHGSSPANLLYSFTGGTDGAGPQSQLVVSGGRLYGTALAGGAGDLGTVFSFDTNSMELATLVDFQFTNGAYPIGGLALSGNTLYGTTAYGGDNGSGAVFKVNTDGSGFAVIYSFTEPDEDTFSNSDGAQPWDSLLLSGNTLYGTCQEGGAAGNGTVFKVDTTGGNFSTLHSFTVANNYQVANSDGAFPAGGLALSGSALYGTTPLGGSAGGGTLFLVHTNGAGFETVYHFRELSGNFTNIDGQSPGSTLIVVSNTLYGTAAYGGTGGNGTVFGFSLSNAIAFSADQYYGAVPFTVQYSAPTADRSGNTITSWHWDFGDGTTSTQQNPSHTYVVPGSFRPVLLATNALAQSLYGSGPSAYVSGPNLIVNGGFETGDFSGWTEIGDFSFTTVIAESDRAFSGEYGAQIAGNFVPCYLAQTLPTFPGAKYLISFWLNSDGATPNEFLTVWDGNAVIDLTNVPDVGWTNIQIEVTATSNSTQVEFGFRNDPDYFGFDQVSVTLESPSVGFTLAPASGPPPLNVHLNGPGIDWQSNTIVSWNWDFGDGTTSTEQNPTHLYTSLGAYQPVLIVTNNLGQEVFGTGPAVSVELVNLLYNGGFEDGDFFDWATNGDFTYSFVTTNSPYVHSGVYGVEMGAVGSLCYLSQDVSVYPGAQYLISVWLYGDGQTPNEFQEIWDGNVVADITNLPAVGWTNVLVSVEATHASAEVQFGFRDDPTDIGFDDAEVGLASPTVNFTVDFTNGPPPLAVQFNSPSTDAGNNPIEAWTWYFGDGATSTEQNPSHTYVAAGNYQPYFLANTSFGQLVGQGPAIVAGYPNVLGNGGFETGDLTDWTTIGDPSFLQVETNYAHSGMWGGQMGPTNAPSYIAQTFGTIPGGEYLISFWVASDGAETNELQVVWDGNTVLDLVNLPEAGWTNIQLTVEATGASTTVEFGFRDDPSWLGFDDASVTYLSGGTPYLNYSVSGTQITLTWPVSEFFLQTATDLAPPGNWQTVHAHPEVIGGQYSITREMGGSWIFFRLSQ